MLPMEQELCKGYEMCKEIQHVQRNKNVLISQNAVHKGPMGAIFNFLRHKLIALFE